MASREVIKRKLVIVGDGACGKTSLLCVFTLGEFPKEYRLRPLSYSKAHAILIGFAVDSPDSLDNARTKWVEEVDQLCPNVPIVLVGLKKDLRTDLAAIEDVRKRSSHFVDAQYAESVARQIGARRYIECSALTGEGVDDVFEVATRASLLVNSPEKSSPCCIIL